MGDGVDLNSCGTCFVSPNLRPCGCIDDISCAGVVRSVNKLPIQEQFGAYFGPYGDCEIVSVAGLGRMSHEDGIDVALGVSCNGIFQISASVTFIPLLPFMIFLGSGSVLLASFDGNLEATSYNWVSHTAVAAFLKLNPDDLLSFGHSLVFLSDYNLDGWYEMTVGIPDYNGKLICHYFWTTVFEI
jgi:hypothetical protein